MRRRPAAQLPAGFVLLAVLASAAAGASAPRVTLVPNAIAFRDARHGLLGTGWLGCNNSAYGCKPRGTISMTADGGRTWNVVLRTPRPVVWVTVDSQTDWARFDDGENLASDDRGRTWHRALGPNPLATPCPPSLAQSVNQAVSTPGGRAWALCAGQGAAGSMAKAVYRLSSSGWKRVAYTPLFGRGGHGGIGRYGYPLGMTMADDSFGLIWESRGTLYLTRDGGSHWRAMPRVARPEVDFGQSAAALPHGVAYLVLGLGGSEHRRLLKTVDRGDTWSVVHRWR
jgi:photosystem II stability/assembly factor-like uncharacterized protein